MAQLYKVGNAWINMDKIMYAYDNPETDHITVFFIGQGKCDFRGNPRLEMVRILNIEADQSDYPSP
jgi:hypothetical protein